MTRSLLISACVMASAHAAMKYVGGLQYAGCSARPDRDLDLFIVRDLTFGAETSEHRTAYQLGLYMLSVDFGSAGVEMTASLGWGSRVDTATCYISGPMQSTLAEVSTSIAKKPTELDAKDHTVTFQPILWLQQNFWSRDKISDQVRRVYFVITHTNPPLDQGMEAPLELASGKPMAENCPLPQALPPFTQMAKAIRDSLAGVAVFYMQLKGAENLWESFLLRLGVDDAVLQTVGESDWTATEIYMLIKAAACPDFYETTSTSTTTKTPVFGQATIEQCLSSMPRCATDPAVLEQIMSDCLLTQK